jgi:hypothetical protein
MEENAPTMAAAKFFSLFLFSHIAISQHPKPLFGTFLGIMD